MKKKNRILIFPLIVTGLIFILTNSCSKEGSNSPNEITDIDGNVYHTVTIGTQVWMVENLKTTKYRNGDPLPNVSDYMAWYTLSTGAYSDYNNMPANSQTYGRLYNWFAIKGGDLCPIGWHVPTYEDWKILIQFLGGGSVAGGKLKESDTTHWHSPNLGATNETGFTGLPGGHRNPSGPFNYLGDFGKMWSSTECSVGSTWARSRDLYFYANYVTLEDSFPKQGGLSIRCIKD